MGPVAMNDSLAVPDIAVRVGGAMTMGIWHQEVIFHRDSAERENEAKYNINIFIQMTHLSASKVQHLTP